MKRQTRLILLTAAAAALASTVQAAYVSGDLLVGFTAPGAANDYLFDLGPYSGLAQNQTWILGTNAGGNFTSAQFANADWGVVGALSLTHTIYSSEGSAGVPAEALNAFNTIRANVAGIGGSSVANSSAQPGQTTANSWFTQTDQPNGTPGNYFFNNLDNPNNKTGAAANLYASDNLGDPASFLGAFTISADGNTLTWAVPEPSSYGLLAGFGLLALYFRRRLGSKS